jgi:hypothetical protein
VSEKLRVAWWCPDQEIRQLVCAWSKAEKRRKKKKRRKKDLEKFSNMKNPKS